MDKWIIYHDDGEQPEYKSGTREEIGKYLAEKYPDKIVEEYTDQVLVYHSVDDLSNPDAVIVASATPE